MTDNETIAVVGGTGKLGAAIALRLAKAGRKVLIGSRRSESAQLAAQGLGHGAIGLANADAAAAGEIVIVTVPFTAQAETLLEIAPYVAGKLVIDTTVPLKPPKVTRVHMPSQGSAAMRALQMLGDQVALVSAFHNVAAHKLMIEGDVGCDVLVFGDDRAARERTIALADTMGLRALHGGVLANSAAAEAMTSVLIFLNKAYGFDGAGICITGMPLDPARESSNT